MFGVAEYRRHGDDPGLSGHIGINPILRSPDDYSEAGRAAFLKARAGDKAFLHGGETRQEAKARQVADYNKMYDKMLKDADTAKQRVQPMLDFLKKTSIRDNIVVYRGLHHFQKDFTSWKKGHVFQDNGVISTSADYEVSKDRFANGKDDRPVGGGLDGACAFKGDEVSRDSQRCHGQHGEGGDRRAPGAVHQRDLQVPILAACVTFGHELRSNG
jgi:hypothetical protein